MISLNAQTLRARFLDIPPNFFSISMGITGLAGVWRLAGNLYNLPSSVSDFLYLLAAFVYSILLASLLAKLLQMPKKVMDSLNHPLVGPFNSLMPINGMLLSVGLQPFAFEAARILFLMFFLATLLLGGWLTGHWIAQKLTVEQFHPGYFLPTVAGGFVGADGAARFGFEGLGWMSFGMGLICWFTLNSIILNRLFFYSKLPAAIIPLLAVELAPPVVGGNAYYNLNGGKIDVVALILAGYCLLMVLVQLRLIPTYLKSGFSVGWWTFTFTYAVTAAYAIRWVNLTQHDWAESLTYFELGAITLFIITLVVRSLKLLWHSLFIAETQHIVVADVRL